MKLKLNVMNISKLKVLRILNLIAIGIPIFLCLLAIVDEGFLYYGLISTMITGGLQICIALGYWFFNKKDAFIIAYFAVVAIYFLSATLGNFNFDIIFVIVPVLLALYLSFIIHFKKHNA